MAASMISRLNIAIQNVEKAVLFTFFGRFPPPEAVFVSASHCIANSQNTSNGFSIRDIIGDGFFYAVPKFRRTVEKRLKRKFGKPEYVWKPLVPMNTLKTCFHCGHDHEVGVLCAHCYNIVKTETKAMQKQISKSLGLTPVEQEVIVLYEGEKNEQPAEFWNGKRVVEMEKPRPPWFSKNLLQRTTQQPATSTDVKPTELA